MRQNKIAFCFLKYYGDEKLFPLTHKEINKSPDKCILLRLKLRKTFLNVQHHRNKFSCP